MRASSTLSVSHCVSLSCSLPPPHPSSHPSFLLSLSLVLPILPPFSSPVLLRHSPCPDHGVLVSRWRMQARAGKVVFLWFLLTAAVWTESRGPSPADLSSRQSRHPSPTFPQTAQPGRLRSLRSPSALSPPLPAPPGSHALRIEVRSSPGDKVVSLRSLPQGRHSPRQ